MGRPRIFRGLLFFVEISPFGVGVFLRSRFRLIVKEQVPGSCKDAKHGSAACPCCFLGSGPGQEEESGADENAQGGIFLWWAEPLHLFRKPKNPLLGVRFSRSLVVV